MTAALRGADKYLASAQERQEASRIRAWSERIIDRANREVSIFDVLEDYFDLYLPRDGASFKSHCPFSNEHADGGMDKGFRTYPGSNSSMCFVQHGYMPPARLFALKYGESQVRAAKRLLGYYGLLEARALAYSVRRLAGTNKSNFSECRKPAECGRSAEPGSESASELSETTV